MWLGEGSRARPSQWWGVKFGLRNALSAFMSPESARAQLGGFPFLMSGKHFLKSTVLIIYINEAFEYPEYM